MKATEEQIAAWQEKYGKGNVFELETDGKFCYVFNPATDINKWKIAVMARRKSVAHLVDSIMANCFIAGDEAFKTDEALKLGIEEQIDEMIETPDFEKKDLENGNIMIIVKQPCGDIECEVKKVTRGDIRYAEDKNRDGKPLNTQIYLLERIAVTDLTEIRKDTKVYLSILLAVNDIKEQKYVGLKKF